MCRRRRRSFVLKEKREKKISFFKCSFAKKIMYLDVNYRANV